MSNVSKANPQPDPGSSLARNTAYQARAYLFSGGNSQLMRGDNALFLLEGNGVGQHLDWQSFIFKNYGFDYRHPPANYPYHLYLELAEYLRTQIHSTLEPDEAYQRISYNACQCYFNGASGQILKIAARVMGPQRGAAQFVANMRNALPWEQHEIAEIRPGYFCYRKDDSGGPAALMLGFLQASLEAAGVTPTILRYHTQATADSNKLIYEAEWV